VGETFDRRSVTTLIGSGTVALSRGAAIPAKVRLRWAYCVVRIRSLCPVCTLDRSGRGPRRVSVLRQRNSARVIIRGHALMQNLRRGHYELAVDARPHRRLESAFAELARTI
jgi:hypothetical protein